MSLSTVVIPVREVVLFEGTPHEQTIRVRGLSFNDIAHAASEYYSEAVMLAGEVLRALDAEQETESAAESMVFSERPEDKPDDIRLQENLDGLIRTALESAPDLVSALVAAAIEDEPDPDKAAEVFRELRLPQQMLLVVAVLEMTFTSSAEVKNFLASLTSAMTALTDAAAEGAATGTLPAN